MESTDQVVTRVFHGLLPYVVIYLSYHIYQAYRSLEQKRAVQIQSPKGPVYQVLVRVNEFIESVTFRFADGSQVRYGSEEGTLEELFELSSDEKIVKVIVNSAFYVHGIQFVTNTGRKSPVYTGSRESITEVVEFVLDDAIGGLSFEQSIHGWIKQIFAVLSVDEVDVSPPPIPDHVKDHGVIAPFRRRHILLWQRRVLFCIYVALVYLWAVYPSIRNLEIHDIWKTSSNFKLAASVVVDFLVLFSCVILSMSPDKLDLTARVLSPYFDPNADKLNNAGENLKVLIRSIDREVLDENNCTLLCWQYRIFITPNWLIKVGYTVLEVVSVDDTRILESRIHSERFYGERVDIVTLLIESRSTLKQFTVQLLQSQFEKFQTVFVEVVQKYREAEAVQAEEAFKPIYYRLLLSQWESGVKFSLEDKVSSSECLGNCGRPPTVFLDKRCLTCAERDSCECEPTWCHECILKWWFICNRTKTEMGPIDPAWQSRCPNCRRYYCLYDIVPRDDLHEYL